MTNAEKMRAWHKRQRDAGKCLTCAKGIPEPGRSVCRVCYKKMHAANLARRKRLDCCCSCGRKLDEIDFLRGAERCAACRRRRNVTQTRRRARQ